MRSAKECGIAYPKYPVLNSRLQKSSKAAWPRQSAVQNAKVPHLKN
jgi:hypothetical protein